MLMESDIRHKEREDAIRARAESYLNTTPNADNGPSSPFATKDTSDLPPYMLTPDGQLKPEYANDYANNARTSARAAAIAANAAIMNMNTMPPLPAPTPVSPPTALPLRDGRRTPRKPKHRDGEYAPSPLGQDAPTGRSRTRGPYDTDSSDAECPDTGDATPKHLDTTPITATRTLHPSLMDTATPKHVKRLESPGETPHSALSVRHMERDTGDDSALDTESVQRGLDFSDESMAAFHSPSPTSPRFPLSPLSPMYSSAPMRSLKEKHLQPIGTKRSLSVVPGMEPVVDVSPKGGSALVPMISRKKGRPGPPSPHIEQHAANIAAAYDAQTPSLDLLSRAVLQEVGMRPIQPQKRSLMYQLVQYAQHIFTSVPSASYVVPYSKAPNTLRSFSQALQGLLSSPHAPPSLRHHILFLASDESVQQAFEEVNTSSVLESDFYLPRLYRPDGATRKDTNTSSTKVEDIASDPQVSLAPPTYILLESTTRLYNDSSQFTKSPFLCQSLPKRKDTVPTVHPSSVTSIVPSGSVSGLVFMIPEDVCILPGDRSLLTVLSNFVSNGGKVLLSPLFQGPSKLSHALSHSIAHTLAMSSYASHRSLFAPFLQKLQSVVGLMPLSPVASTVDLILSVPTLPPLFSTASDAGSDKALHNIYSAIDPLIVVSSETFHNKMAFILSRTWSRLLYYALTGNAPRPPPAASNMTTEPDPVENPMAYFHGQPSNSSNISNIKFTSVDGAQWTCANVDIAFHALENSDHMGSQTRFPNSAILHMTLQRAV